MKIETSIKPRTNGTVRATIDGVLYVFEADDDGNLVAEVEKEAHISALLARDGEFLPADDADFVLADTLVRPVAAADDELHDDPADENSDPNAAPIEEPASAVSAKVAARAARVKAK